MLFALSAQLRNVLQSYDLSQFFLQNPLRQPSAKNLYMYPPRELIFKDNNGVPIVFKITNSVYGLKSAAHDSHQTIKEHFLVDHEMKISHHDTCLYAKANPAYKEWIEKVTDIDAGPGGWSETRKKNELAPARYIFQILHVDDGILCGDPETVKEFTETLSKRFNIGETGPCNFIVGIKVDMAVWCDITNKPRQLLPNQKNKVKGSQRALAIDILREHHSLSNLLDEEDRYPDNFSKEQQKPKSYDEIFYIQPKEHHPDHPKRKTPLDVDLYKLMDENLAHAQQEAGMVPHETPPKETKRYGPRHEFGGDLEEHLRQLQPLRTIARFNYLGRMTRPDLSLFVSCVARHIHKPSWLLVHALEQGLEYLFNTVDLGIIFTEDAGPHKPTWYFDASYPYGKPRTAMICMWRGGPIDWKSTLGKTAAGSTKQAEILAGYMSFLKGLPTKKDFNLLSIMQRDEAALFLGDNTTCISTMKGTTADGGNMKHLDQKILCSFDWILAGEIDVQHVDTYTELADHLTKQQPSELFFDHRTKIMGMGYKPSAYN